MLSKNFLTPSREERLSETLRNAVQNEDKENIIYTFNALLASIPYDDYEGAIRLEAGDRAWKIGPREWLYRSSLLCFVRGAEIPVDAELHNSHGRADMVIRDETGKTLIIEIKIAPTAGEVEEKLAEALAQIKERDYAAQFPNAKTLAIVIDDEKRKIVRWE